MGIFEKVAGYFSSGEQDKTGDIAWQERALPVRKRHKIQEVSPAGGRGKKQ
jgi:hypothetical protein